MDLAVGKGNGRIGCRSAAHRVAPRSREGLTLPLEQALMDRMKELHCLQSIERIISTIARIRWGDRYYQIGDRERYQSVESPQIRGNDRVYGSVDMGYTDHFEEASEEHFLA